MPSGNIGSARHQPSRRDGGAVSGARGRGGTGRWPAPGEAVPQRRRALPRVRPVVDEGEGERVAVVGGHEAAERLRAGERARLGPQLAGQRVAGEERRQRPGLVGDRQRRRQRPAGAGVVDHARAAAWHVSRSPRSRPEPSTSVTPSSGQAPAGQRLADHLQPGLACPAPGDRRAELLGEQLGGVVVARHHHLGHHVAERRRLDRRDGGGVGRRRARSRSAPTVTPRVAQELGEVGRGLLARIAGQR